MPIRRLFSPCGGSGRYWRVCHPRSPVLYRLVPSLALPKFRCNLQNWNTFHAFYCTRALDHPPFCFLPYLFYWLLLISQLINALLKAYGNNVNRMSDSWETMVRIEIIHPNGNTKAKCLLFIKFISRSFLFAGFIFDNIAHRTICEIYLWCLPFESYYIFGKW